MAIGKGCYTKIYAAATATPTNFVEHMNDLSLKFEGKTVEITEFAATCPAYVARATGIKDVTATISGYLDKAATGQGFFWANHVSGQALFVKFGFGATGAEATFEFQANVDSIDITTTTDGYQQVTYNLSNYGAAAPTIGP